MFTLNMFLPIDHHQVLVLVLGKVRLIIQLQYPPWNHQVMIIFDDSFRMILSVKRELN